MERSLGEGICYDDRQVFLLVLVPRSASMSGYRLHQIVSGGQTGVDRAALDVAIFLQIPHGGWCPRGRQAEDGPIAPLYRLRETPESDYAVRTERNVIDSAGTLILYYQELSGGTKLTAQLAGRYRRPKLLVDLAEAIAPETVLDWLVVQQIDRLNIAGPRESSVRGIGRLAEEFLLQVFAHARAAEVLGLSNQHVADEADSDGFGPFEPDTANR